MPGLGRSVHLRATEPTRTTAEPEPQSPSAAATEPARRKCGHPGPRAKRPSEKPRRKKPEHRSYRKSAQDSEDPAVPKINKAATAARAKKGRHRTKNANAPDATARVKTAETANFVFSILPQ